MNPAQDQQSRAAYEDGKWYWVEHEGWHGEPPTIAPACYKAECDAWYSYIFSGISTPYLKVLGPCELQAARALPRAEPVAGQCRFVGDAAWLGCAAEHVRAVLAAPQDWEGYEVRYLYAEAQRPPAAKEQGLLQQFLQAAKDAGIERLACWCECCDTVANSGFRSRMSICPKCGDKRCPRAYHHNSDCSAP
ncbi:MAG: hypothetical protein RR311_15460 [Comamonas sp.]